MAKIVLWDFDGVLADTLAECYQITRATVENNKKRISAELQSDLAPYPFEEFKGDRPFCVNATDFFVHYLSRRRFGSVEENALAKIRRKYAGLIVFLDERYYEQRHSLAQRLGKKYFELMRPYDGIIDALKQLHSFDVRQAVMTARDEPSAEGWLRHYDVNDCFDLVVGTEVSRADRQVKQKQIRLLKRHFGGGEYFFVDDLAHNLEVVRSADASIQLVFAAWGYGKVCPEAAVAAKTPPDLPEIVRKRRPPGAKA